jgi:hypothetical protein
MVSKASPSLEQADDAQGGPVLACDDGPVALLGHARKAKASRWRLLLRGLYMKKTNQPAWLHIDIATPRPADTAAAWPRATPKAARHDDSKRSRWRGGKRDAGHELRSAVPV